MNSIKKTIRPREMTSREAAPKYHLERCFMSRKPDELLLSQLDGQFHLFHFHTYLSISLSPFDIATVCINFSVEICLNIGNIWYFSLIILKRVVTSLYCVMSAMINTCVWILEN